MDVTHVSCGGADASGHLTAVIDCHDRDVTGYEFALRLRQEFITRYTPEQNGFVERFFRSLKEECVWLHNFGRFSEAIFANTKWIHWYDAGRPHQTLGYRSQRQFLTQNPKSNPRIS